MKNPRSTEPLAVRLTRFIIGIIPYALVGYGIFLGANGNEDAPFWFVFGGTILWVLMFLLRIGAREAALSLQGVQASARVLAAEPRGRINEQPAYKVSVRVTPEDGGEPFELSKRMVADGVQALRLQSNQPVTVSYLPQRRKVWRIEWDESGVTPQVLFGEGQSGAATETGRIADLERLVALRDRGALTDAEFAAEKQRLYRVDA